ncbi:urea carboxylase [Altererythrobacter sp. B11]|uniref:urea carboxylase n=1 Tax=Altererythrobacter sp. B11 TaxID=2060312 RepID=UPI000DC70A9D|nr:urea carboxylase [Altererythrobacter sp. B11]BBC73950.1 urea carboxylase [Altererythrobacter sp. B11]
MSFDTVLIANRGAIATRIIRTVRRMGLRSVAVYSEADAGSLHVSEADVAVCIGPAPAAESYLNVAAVLKAARETGAGAIHPGYGFLSENTDFAEICAAEGIVFIGPTPENIRTFGLKHSARAMAAANGVPLAPGTDLLTDEEEAAQAAREIGFPVILKATAGGGGIGMRICEDEKAVRQGFAAVARLGEGNFGDAGVFLERYIGRARHVEVQIYGDGQGRVMPLGERDCSLQRRNQKVVEEAPAPCLSEAKRAELIAAAVRLGEAAHYRSAGTVEFLFDAEREEFFFLEVNTRLQVEHGVTEEVMGVDLVEWMIRGAAGDYSFLDREPPVPQGHAMQVRLYAEDPALDYRPTVGTLTDVSFPEGVRAETWCMAGTAVSAWYDPMLAKLIVHAPSRIEAAEAMQAALDESRLDGIETNLRWLRDVVRDPRFISGEVSTRLLESVAYTPRSIRVIAGGTATTVQDWPGRQGLWAIGVPPSGPMDDRSFRLGNRVLGNAEGTAGLEITASGPTLLFNAPTRICLTGADFGATLDGEPVARGTAVEVAAGQTLAVGRAATGMRGYILFAGGLDIAPYLGSRSTFALGQFGGHAARRLLAGDTLHLAEDDAEAKSPAPPAPPAVEMPEFTGSWNLRVLYGPHGAPDFFTQDDIGTILAAEWQVHYNSNRTGVRLVGPKPEWARKDGGEAGLHPSNIHDNPYAIGAVDFTGDMPIILGPDGPSLGGFVCPFTVIAADRWKLGQLAPGDRVRLVPVTAEDAAAADRAPLERLERDFPVRDPATLSPILAETPARGVRPRTVYRQQGDRNILVEYGPIVLDIELRIRVHALMTELEALASPGVIDIVPGIRSLQLHFDGEVLDQQGALALLMVAEEALGDLEDFSIPSRIVHLPLSWRDPATIETIEKYMGAVRDDAPWCPDNIEFIRRINGLPDADAVERLIFDASYLVLGLGDVYLGAPVATPVDPRHRLVTTKYNPARTWTPPNVVGIGGAYMCIYGMEGPGGYQLFGRTIQVWNTHRQTDAFVEGKPWLLRFFDQIRFFEVSADELADWRRDFPNGRRSVEVEHTEFRLADYRAFLAENARSITEFEQQRQAAFDEERAAWQRSGEFDRISDLADEEAGAGEVATVDVPEGAELVEAPFGGSVWKLMVAPGDTVETGDIIAVIETMKMECPLESPGSGTVAALYMQERQSLQPGAPLLALRPHA